MKNIQSLKYAFCSTLFTWVAILLFLWVMFQESMGYSISNPMSFIPLLSTFISGFYLFNRIKEPWLLGIVHYVLAHVLVFVLVFVLRFSENFVELGLSKINVSKSYMEGSKAVFYSLFGIQFVLPCFVFGGYWCKKKIK